MSRRAFNLAEFANGQLKAISAIQAKMDEPKNKKKEGNDDGDSSTE